MRHERFLDPISATDPCGPDLDETGDEDYINYVIPAESRVPEQYFAAGDAKQLDTEKIEIGKELASIDALLERSRDLRLLTLEARFQSFFGTLTGFVGCLEVMAALLELFWADVHPQAMDGDFTLRRNTLEALDDMAQVIIPLQHLAIVRDSRVGNITVRHYLLGAGLIQPREGEKAADLSNLTMRLGGEENRTAAEAAHAVFGKGIASLASLRAAFIDNEGYGSEPNFERLQKFLAQGLGFIEAARPDLNPASESGAAPQAAPAPAADGAQTSTAPAVAGAAAAPAGAVMIASQAEARAALAAARGYFLSSEPSSPALIIVHQAHSLIGKPITIALDALMPNSSDRAVIRFDPAYEFQISMSSMRALAEAAGASGEEAAADRTFAAATRGEAAALMAGVEAFLRTAEPSSPVPLLLSRARAWLSRDFTSILNDLLPRQS